MRLLNVVAAAALLVIVLGSTFLLLLGAISFQEPVIVNHVITGDEGLAFLTPAEKSHMDDVAALVRGGVQLLFAALLFVLLYAQRQPLTKRTAHTSSGLGVLLLLLLIPFNSTFTWLHTILFPQGNWQFPADSWLIMHFPLQAFAVWGVIWLLSTVVVLIAFARVLKR